MSDVKRFAKFQSVLIMSLVEFSVVTLAGFCILCRDDEILGDHVLRDC